MPLQSSSTTAVAGPSVMSVTVAGSWLRALIFMAPAYAAAGSAQRAHEVVLHYFLDRLYEGRIARARSG